MSSKAQNEMFDGVVNPSGFINSAAVLLYFAFIPVTSYLTRDGGFVQSAIQTVVNLTIPSTSGIAASRTIPALAALYGFVTYAATAALSSASQAAASPAGLNPNHPRSEQRNLRGLPLRLFSMHHNLMDVFPFFAVSAALAQALAPNNQQIQNLLGLHVLVKLAVYLPAYAAAIAPVRGFSHVFAISALVNVCWTLAAGAK